MAGEDAILVDASLSPHLTQSRSAAEEVTSASHLPQTCDQPVVVQSSGLSGPDPVTTPASPPASGTASVLSKVASPPQSPDASLQPDEDDIRAPASTFPLLTSAAPDIAKGQAARAAQSIEIASKPDDALPSNAASPTMAAPPKQTGQEHASAAESFVPGVAPVISSDDNITASQAQRPLGLTVSLAEANHEDGGNDALPTHLGGIQTFRGDAEVDAPQEEATEINDASDGTGHWNMTTTPTSQEQSKQAISPPRPEARPDTRADVPPPLTATLAFEQAPEALTRPSAGQDTSSATTAQTQPDMTAQLLTPSTQAVDVSLTRPATNASSPLEDSSVIAASALVVGETASIEPAAVDGETISTKLAADDDEQTAEIQRADLTTLPDAGMQNPVDATAVESSSDVLHTSPAPSVSHGRGESSGDGEAQTAAQGELSLTETPPQKDSKSSPMTAVSVTSTTEEPATSTHPPAASTTAVSPAALSPQHDSLIPRQIALLLKINKELIRLCVELQAKEMTGDVMYKTSAIRLQSNLGFLAGLTESASGKPSATLNDEPFPATMHAPDSLLPKLYAHLRSLSTTAESPTAAGKKRRRGTSEIESSPARGAPNRAGSVGQKAAAVAAPPAGAPASKPRTSTTRRKSGTAGAVTAGSPGVSATGLTAPSMTNGFAAANGPPRSTASPAPPNTASAAGSPSQQPNGVRPSGPTPQQLQGLIQAFGQNAVSNLNALQAHYRGGQSQALVNYMEANVANFRNLPLQMQLQHMATVQNAALQRQRQASVAASASSPNASGAHVASQVPQPRPTPPSRRASAAPSPAGGSAAAEHMRRNTQSPMAAPATPFQSAAAAQHMQQQHNGNAPTMMTMPFAAANNLTSPAAAAAAASPGAFQQQQQQQQHYQHVMQQQQAQQMGNPYAYAAAQQPMPQLTTSQTQQLISSLPASLSGLPAHLQQQFVQQVMQQQQQQQQQQLTAQPMAAPDASGGGGGGGLNPMMTAMLQQQAQQEHSGNPTNMFRGVGAADGSQGSPQQTGVPNLANMWAAMQQQQNPPSSSS